MSAEQEQEASALANYGGFHTDLDCELCGGPFQVEGDVSAGEKVTCDNCGAELEVIGR